jgi:hypothetical protein
MLNPFFLQGSSGEQNLVQDLINEQIKIYGVEVYYLPRAFATENKVIREVIQSKFQNAYPLEAYVENFNGYDGQGTILSKFGIQDVDDLTLVVSQERFKTYITPFLSGIDDIKTPSRPKEGDLIYFPLGDRIFEIKFVEHEKPFYQLQKNYTYELQCELFRYSEEIIDTDIEFIDDNVEDVGVITTLKMLGGGTGASAYTNIVNGGVRFVNVLNRGSGFKSRPTTKFSQAPSSGITAVGVATMMSGIVDICEPNPNLSRVQGVEIANPGSGYTQAPMISFVSDSGSGAAATCTLGDGIVGIVTISESGSGYVFEPIVSFIGASSVTANARAIVENGEVTKIRIIDAGVGYTSTPTISIGPPGQVAATATASIVGSSVTAITLTNAGNGYTTEPTITISPPDLPPETAVHGSSTSPLGSNRAYFTTTNSGRYYLNNELATTEYVGLETNRSFSTKFDDPNSYTRYSYNYAVGTPDTLFNKGTTQQAKIGFWFKTSFRNINQEIDDLIVFSNPGSVTHYYGGNVYNDSFKFAFGINENGYPQLKLDDGFPIKYTLSGSSNSRVDDGQWHWIFINTNDQNQITFSLDGGSNLTHGAGTNKALYGIGPGGKFSNSGMTSNEHRIQVYDYHVAQFSSTNISKFKPTEEQDYDSLYTRILTANFYDVAQLPVGHPSGQVGVQTFASTIYSLALRDVNDGSLTVYPSAYLDHEIVGFTSFSIPSPTGSAINFVAEASTSIGVGGTVIITLTDGGGGYSAPPVIELENPVILGTYTFNEVVVGETSGTTARVKSWNSVSKYLEVSNMTGAFIFKENIVGQDSGATYQLYQQNDYNIQDSQDDFDRGEMFADNVQIEIDADAILDFTEENPFGTP